MDDAYYIKKTFELARKAEGDTSPNPLVGAIIVREGKIIGSGFHKKAGSAHAEIEAFNKAGSKAFGATLYVNLEPCCHFGKTGPCVDEIIKKGVKRVVVSTLDPNPLVSGISIKKLDHAGIKTKIGILRDEACRLNEVFFKNMKTKLPFVAAKFAQSLDGKITDFSGSSRWITSLKSRLYAKGLRDKYDAVLVGINTVLKDNPSLNGLKKISNKIIIDPDLRIPLSCDLVKKYSDKLIIITSKKNTKKIPKNIRIVYIKANKGLFDLRQCLKQLYKFGVTSIFAEGGSVTSGHFFKAKLVDKVYFFIAPKIIGGKSSLSSISGSGFSLTKGGPIIMDLIIKRINEDILITGYPKYI